jgi:hypothetical protein
MRPFLLSIIAAVVLGLAAAALLSGAQQRAYEAYATSATRVSDPGYNLVGPKWSGEPSGKGS